MCCQCCKSKSFWFSKQVIIDNACPQLIKQASSVEELALDGIDIQSQKTNEQLDDEEDDNMTSDADMHTWADQNNLKHLSLELAECKKKQVFKDETKTNSVRFVNDHTQNNK